MEVPQLAVKERKTIFLGQMEKSSYFLNVSKCMQQPVVLKVSTGKGLEPNTTIFENCSLRDTHETEAMEIDFQERLVSKI